MKYHAVSFEDPIQANLMATVDAFLVSAGTTITIIQSISLYTGVVYTHLIIYKQ